jgi:hypothetical protein
MSSVCIAALSYVLYMFITIVEEDLAPCSSLFICRPIVFRERGGEGVFRGTKWQEDRENCSGIFHGVLKY